MATWRRGPSGWGLGPFAAHSQGLTWRNVGLSTLFTGGGLAAELSCSAEASATVTAALFTNPRFAAQATSTATGSAALRTQAGFATNAAAVASVTATFIENLPSAGAVATASGQGFLRANGGGQQFLKQFTANTTPQSGTLTGFGFRDMAVIFTWVPHTLGVVGDGVVDLTGEWTKVASTSAITSSTKWIATAWIAPLPSTAATRTYSFQFSSGAASPQGVIGVQYVRGGEYVSASTVAYTPGGASLWVPPPMPVASTEGVLASAWFTSDALAPLSTMQGWPDPSPEYRATEQRTLVGFSSGSGSLTLVASPLADDFLPAQRGVTYANSGARGVISLLFKGYVAPTVPQFSAVARCSATAAARLGPPPSTPTITYIGTTGDRWTPTLTPFTAPPDNPNLPSRATYALEIAAGEVGDLLVLTVLSDAQHFEMASDGWTLAAPPRRLQGQPGGGDARGRLYVYWRYDDQSYPGMGTLPKYPLVMRGIGTFDTPYSCVALMQCHRFRGAQIARPGYLFGEGVEAANSGFTSLEDSLGIGVNVIGTTLARAPNSAVSATNSMVMGVWSRSKSVSWSGTITPPAGMTALPRFSMSARGPELLDFQLDSAYKLAGPGQTGVLDSTNDPEMFGRAGVTLVLRPQGVGALFHAAATNSPKLVGGALANSTGVAANATALATLTAALTTGVGNSIAATAQALASVTATLRIGALLSASPAATATGTAALALGQGFAAQPSALAAVTASLRTLWPTAAAPQAQSTVTAQLLTLWPAYANLQALASAQAALRAAPRFYAAAQAVASASMTTPAEKVVPVSWALRIDEQRVVRIEPAETTYRRPL